MKQTRHTYLGLGWLSGLGLLALTGCYGGVQGESFDSVGGREVDQAPLPPVRTNLRPIQLTPRGLFGAGNTASNLAYREALANNDASVMSLFDTTGPAEERMNPRRPLMFFITPHTNEEGAGPLFNQRMCLGCHQSQDDIRRNNEVAQQRGEALWSGPAALNTVSTPVSRAGRQGVTVHSQITRDLRPPTAAFTLYGDFFPLTGTFDPIAFLGGPLQHVKAVGECDLNRIPPESVDPNLRGGTDPVTGISPIGATRQVGERAGPPYIGRGLIDSIYQGDLVANDDPADALNVLGPFDSNQPNRAYSSLPPFPDSTICPGDCISGRHNENIAEGIGPAEENVFRVGRFGLRAAGVTMLQFDTGGTQGEIGLTSPFSPREQNNAQNVGRNCDTVPDPELVADVIRNLRSMIRMIAPPEQDAMLFERNPAVGTMAWEVQEGARLFGLDIEAFRTRVTPGASPMNFGDADADRGLARDRGLGCAQCHIPIQPTGRSRANVGAQYISERWAPLFSDLILHANPRYPFIRPDRLRPLYPGTIDRNLGDFAIPAPVTGIALGHEFRTPPLAGIGKTGAPFMHDARVYLNIRPAPQPSLPPYSDANPPSAFPYDNEVGWTLRTFTEKNAAGQITQWHVNERLDVTNLETALLAAIEIHDLPAPPLNPNPERYGPDENLCPPVSGDVDICRYNSQFRGEARVTMQKFRQLSLPEQMYVVRFLESL